MKKIILLLLCLFLYSVLRINASMVMEIVPSMQMYKVHGLNGHEVEISQALVDISSMLQAAVGWATINKQTFLDLPSIDIEALKLLDKLANNKVNSEDSQLIASNLNTLMSYMHPLLINHNILKSFMIQYLIDNHFVFLIKNNLVEYELYKQFKTPYDFVPYVVMSVDGKYIIYGSDHNVVDVLNTENNELIKYSVPNEQEISSIAISSDNSFFITGCAFCPYGFSEFGLIKVWNMHSGELIRNIKSDSYVSSIVISDNNRYIIPVYGDTQVKTIKVLDMQSGELVRELVGHTETINSVAITSDSKYIVSGSNDKTIRIWDLETGNQLYVLEGHEENVTSVAITSNNKYIVSGSDDNTIKIWDMVNGKLIKTLNTPYETATSIAITLDGQCIVSSFYNGSIRIWNINNGEEIKSLIVNSWQRVNKIEISSNKQFISYGENFGQVVIWKLKKSDLLQQDPFKILSEVQHNELKLILCLNLI